MSCVSLARHVIRVCRVYHADGATCHGDEAVGVGRVADDEDLDVARGELREGAALLREDARILLQQLLQRE